MLINTNVTNIIPHIIRGPSTTLITTPSYSSDKCTSDKRGNIKYYFVMKHLFDSGLVAALVQICVNRRSKIIYV